MKSAFITACKAFANQAKQNYNSFIIRQYNKLNKSTETKPTVKK